MIKGRLRNALSGFTMVELLVALVLGTFIIGGIISLFSISKSSYYDNERAARLQENGRLALFFLTRDLRHASFWGPLLKPGSLSGSMLEGSENCKNWANGNPLTDPLIGSSNPAGSIVLSCMGADQIQANTSVVALKGVSSDDSITLNYSSSNPNPRRFFVRADSVGGQMLQEGVGNGSAAPAPTSGLSDWLYQPKIYYVRDYSADDGDGIPTLCVLQGNPTLSTQCLVEGIEFMHIEYGIDGDGNGVPETYTDSPSATQIQDAVTAKVYLIIRDLKQDPAYTDDNTYQLGGKTINPMNDHFHRAVFGTTIVMQNQRTLPVRG